MTVRFVTLTKSPLHCAVGAELGLTAEDMKAQGEDGKADFLMRVDVVVTGTASGAVSAMTLAQRKTFLDTLTLDLRFDLGGGNKRPSDGGADDMNRFHPQQAQTFRSLRLRALRLCRQEMDGLTDSTTGLATAWSGAGAFTREFSLYTSMGRVEQVKENESLFGVGPDLLELMLTKLRVVSDGLKAYNSALTTTDVQAVFKVLRLPAPKGARMAAIPAMTRRYQPQATSAVVRSNTGIIPVDAIDPTTALGATPIDVLTVEVGGHVVTDRPDTPDDVREGLLQNLVNASGEDTTISADATEIYAIGDVSFAQLLAGQVVANQEVLNQAWDLWVTGLPALNEDEQQRLMQALAAQGLKDGQAFHFTNAAAVAGLKQTPGANYTASGLMYWFTSTPEAQEFPGVRVNKKGEAQISIPAKFLELAAGDYARAQLDTTAGATGNVAAMDAAVNNLGVYLPTFLTDTEKGFPKSNGGEDSGSQSGTYRRLRSMVQTRAGQLIAQARAPKK